LESLEPAVIQRRIDHKAKRLPDYASEIDSSSLLVVLEGSAFSSIMDLPSTLVTHPFRCPFDRVFLFEGFNGRALELIGRE
jgi:hypothetical protein